MFIPGVLAQGDARHRAQTLTAGLFTDTDTFYSPGVFVATKFDANTATLTSLTSADTVATNLSATSTIHGVSAGAYDARVAHGGVPDLYWEVTLTNLAGGSLVGIGISIPGLATAVTPSFLDGAMMYPSTGNVYGTGINNLVGSLGARATGDVIGCAFNASQDVMWFRKVNGTPSGWNHASNTSPGPGSSFSPAATVQSFEPYVPWVTFGGTGGASGNVLTAKFSPPFVGVVPSGFIPVWPAAHRMFPSKYTETDQFFNPVVTP